MSDESSRRQVPRLQSGERVKGFPLSFKGHGLKKKKDPQCFLICTGGASNLGMVAVL